MGKAETSEPDHRASLAEELDRIRDRGFVGRASELTCFTDGLSGRSPERILFVHGPGGIGKTTLLDAFARLAAAADRTPVYVDARDLECSSSALVAAIAAHGERSPGEPPQVLLIDGYELLRPLDRWIRQELLARLPANTVMVLAGREPPPVRWRLDSGWHRLTRVLPLGELEPQESDDLLGGFGLSPERRRILGRIGRGHPLVLALLAETYGLGPTPSTFAEAPDLVAQLCGLILDDIPDAAHRTGLATCAHASRMTADLLARTVGPRADEVWAWLESRPYVRRGIVGLFVHDVVREIFEAEFARRSPDAYVDLHMVVRDYFLQRLVNPTEPRPDRAAAEILFLHRAGPLAEMTATLRAGGLLPVARAGPEDRAGILKLIERGEGARSAALAQRWVEAQPDGLYRARSDAGVEGFALQIYLPTGTALDHDDPIAAAVLATVAARGPLRPGERINVNRFAGASGSYQRDPILLLVNGVACILEWGTRAAAWTFITTVEPELYGPYFEYLGFTRMWDKPLPGARRDADGRVRQIAGYGWDRRRFPTERLFELMARRELTGEQGPPPADLLRPAPLDRAAFDAAVRAALPCLGRPDRLAGSVLLGSALVPALAPDPIDGLAATLTESIRALANERGGAEHERVLTRTFLKAAPSQVVAAEVLGLPFSTYRRHLAQAQERLIEVLWSIEIGEHN